MKTTLFQTFIKAGLALMFLLFLESCAKNPVTGKRELMLVSKDQEKQMGAEADPQITAFFGLYDDPELQRFITQKGNEMAQISHRSNLDFEFKVVDSPVINAFAVPGGYVYFTRGIMAHFNNEAEFAGVLGHEIGHVTARHSAQQQSKQMLAQVGLVAGMMVSETFAQFADLAGQGVGLLFLKFGRDAERESDRLGVEYSTKIGYNAHEMADFFRTLERSSALAGAQPIPNFLSTHPDPGERLETVHALADQWQKKVKTTNLEVGRDSYLKLIDGIVYGEDPKQGYREGDMFYHPVMKFQFPVPNGWMFQNTPQQVQMAPQNGEALMSLTLAPGESLDDAGRQILEGYQLKLVDSRRVTVNGLSALAMVADQTTEQGTIRALIYLIDYGNTIYNIMGLSTLQNFDQYSRIFTNTMENFKPLTDPAKINVTAERIVIKSVPQTGSLAQVLQQLNMPQERHQELAILNGMELNEQVQRGTLIKTVSK